MERKTFNKVEVHSRLGIARTSSALPSARRTFSMVFFCKKTKVTKKGKAPIYVHIKTCGTATEIYTQCQIEPQRWNQRLERSLYKDEIDMQINSIVASYRANILTAYDQLIKRARSRRALPSNTGWRILQSDKLAAIDCLHRPEQ